MRVLIVQNHYIGFGGDDVVVANESTLLKQKGHAVLLWSLKNDELLKLMPKIKTALNLTYNRSVKNALARHIEAFAPDIVHCHNLFPLITAAAYDAAIEAKIPVVQTLHDFRLICCAGAFLYRQQKPCELCLTGSSYWGAWHRCYRNSWIGSLLLAHTLDFHRRRHTLQRQIQQFIALSTSSKRKFVEAGLPEDRISIKPNFIYDPGYPGAETRSGALFVGRLSPEKGLTTLIKAWEKISYPLQIVGTGPLLKDLQNNVNPWWRLQGHHHTAAVNGFMRSAEFLIMPSEWTETFGLVIIEAFANGLPVIASRLGAMEDNVEDGVTGLHFNPGDVQDLADKVMWAITHPTEMAKMGMAARRIYETFYQPDENYRQLRRIYEQALEKR